MNATDPLGPIRNGIEELTAALALWAVRDDTAAWETTPAAARTAAGNAVAAIDDVLRELHQLRSRLIDETRAYDDESGRRTDELLERLRAERSGVIPLPDEESDDQLLDEWHDTGSGPGE